MALFVCAGLNGADLQVIGYARGAEGSPQILGLKN
jgi:hypothetical protein